MNIKFFFMMAAAKKNVEIWLGIEAKQVSLLEIGLNQVQ
jgi:hypothetical protein